MSRLTDRVERNDKFERNNDRFERNSDRFERNDRLDRGDKIEKLDRE